MVLFEMSQGVILTGEHAAACVVDTLKSADVGYQVLRPTIPRGILYALSACRASPSCCIQLIETIFAHGVSIRTLKDLAEHWIGANHAIAGVCGSFGQRIHGSGVSFTGCVVGARIVVRFCGVARCLRSTPACCDFRHCCDVAGLLFCHSAPLGPRRTCLGDSTFR